jgi:hypothetical protein
MTKTKKSYFIISLFLFLIMYMGINVAIIIWGRDAPVPLVWSIIFGLIIINIIIAAVWFTVDMVREYLK